MNLTELIRAVIDRHICTCQSSNDNKRLLTEAIVKAIPKREHGEWIDYVSGANWATCSACGKSNKILKRWKYCPECGTEMKGIKEKTWK